MKIMSKLTISERLEMARLKAEAEAKAAAKVRAKQESEAWDEGDEANWTDAEAADLRAQRAEQRELKGE